MNKYLTIGSMCDLKGDENNTKYLIIGYKKNDKDYEAVLFPQGTTGGGQFKYFNADEVDEIYDLGYKDSIAIKYLSDLFSKNDSNVLLYDDKDVVSSIENNLSVSSSIGNLVFDENGVVIAQGSSASVETTSVPSLGELKFDENGVVIAQGSATSVETTPAPSLGELKFDENGVVIAQGNATSVDITSAPSLGELKFDENGVVIAQGNTTSVETTSAPSLGELKFDENGVVIAS